MILKIVLDDGREFAVYVYENNFDGEIQVNDTFKLDDWDIGIGFDDVFGTNEKMLTLSIESGQKNMILYKEEDGSKYCFYLMKPLEKFNKVMDKEFKYETDAIRFAIEYMMEEKDWRVFDMCEDCDDMTTCEHNACSLYFTQFLSEFGSDLETYVWFEDISELGLEEF